MEGPFSLRSTYLHLRPDNGATAMEGGDTFWKGLEQAAISRPGAL